MAGYVSPERKALQTRSNIFIVLGLVGQLAANLLMGVGQTPATATTPATPGTIGLVLGLIVGIAALVCWFIGLSAYCRSKGYSKWYSLLGLLSCCGLLVLILLPNKWVDTPTNGVSGDYPRPQG